MDMNHKIICIQKKFDELLSGSIHYRFLSDKFSFPWWEKIIEIAHSSAPHDIFSISLSRVRNQESAFLRSTPGNDYVSKFENHCQGGSLNLNF